MPDQWRPSICPSIGQASWKKPRPKPTGTALAWNHQEQLLRHEVLAKRWFHAGGGGQGLLCLLGYDLHGRTCRYFRGTTQGITLAFAWEKEKQVCRDYGCRVLASIMKLAGLSADIEKYNESNNVPERDAKRKLGSVEAGSNLRALYTYFRQLYECLTGNT